MRTLLTGFGPFAEINENPSALLAEYFARAGAPGHILTTRVLPVSFQRSEEKVRKLIAEGDFGLVLMLGVAQNESEIRLERFGHNLDAARIQDVDGRTPLAISIRSGAPERYETIIALQPIVEALAGAGLPARISESAGEYVCNHAYFAALHYIALNRLATQCLFVHVPLHQPLTEEIQHIPIEDQIRAVEVMLGAFDL